MTLARKKAGEPSQDAVDDVARAFLEGNVPSVLHVPGAHTSLVHYAATGFVDWLARVPLAEQKRWTLHVPRNPEMDEPDDGVIWRTDERSTDQKVFLHVREDLMELLLTKNDVEVGEPWRSWLLACDQLREACLSTAYRLASALDHEAPELHVVDRLRAAETGPCSSLLRVLQYENGESGFAKPHVDRNGFSFALGASDNGLFFPREGERFHPETAISEHSLVFPGAQLATASGGRIQACVHGSDPVKGSHKRWAVVCFIYLAQ